MNTKNASTEGVTDVKVEKESDDKVESEIELYADHEIKEEMVIGPVVLQQVVNIKDYCEDVPATKKPRLEVKYEKTEQVEPHQKEIIEDNTVEIVTHVIKKKRKKVRNKEQTKCYNLRTYYNPTPGISDDEVESDLDLYADHEIKEEMDVTRTPSRHIRPTRLPAPPLRADKDAIPGGSGESSGGGRGSQRTALYAAIVPAVPVEASPTSNSIQLDYASLKLNQRTGSGRLRALQEPAPARPIRGTSRRSPFSNRPLRDAEIGIAINNSGSEESDQDEQEEEGQMPLGSNFELLRVIREQERELLLEAENEEMDVDAASSPASPLAGDAMPEVADESAVVSGKFEWSEDYGTFRGVQESYTRVPGPTADNVNPYELFCFVWDDEILRNIAIQTNLYAWQTIAPIFEDSDVIAPHSRLRDWRDTDVSELKRFFAVLIYMSLDYRSRLEEYWNTGILGMTEFRRIMSRDRFFILLKFLHFVDNNNITEAMDLYRKKVAKVIPVVEHCNAKFQEMYVPNRELSLDESLLLWKGHLSWVQCLRTKAARFGIKSFDLCEAESGYLLKTILCTERDTSSDDGIPIHGFENLTAKVVLKLMNGYLDVGHALYMDNWYNQMPLTRFLKEHKTDVVGTQNRRRLHVPNAIKEVTQRTLAPGQMIWRHCGDMNLVVWRDVKLVAFVSTFHPKGTARGERAGKTVEKPSMVNDCNRYMGGVDQKDQMLSMYLMERKRGTKWYLKVFRRCINTSLFNGFIIQKINRSRAGQPYLTHRQYRFAVAEQLVQRNRVPDLPRPIVAVSEARLSGSHDVDHTSELPNGTRQRRRCVRCSALGKRTVVRTICIQCNVGLCLGACFREYHLVKNLAIRPSVQNLAE